MRIISGKMKGFSLKISKDKNTRPLKDMVKESIFNLLIHSKKISFKFEKSNILDLYAGTGSFGLECLSRQAGSVYFVEGERDVIKILEKNIENLKLKKKSKIFFGDVFKMIEKINNSKTKFNLIFCDPPFKNTNIENLLKNILDKNILIAEGILILHRNKNTKQKFPNYFKIIDKRTYGMSQITFGNFLP